MSIYSEKWRGKRAGKFDLNTATQDCHKRTPMENTADEVFCIGHRACNTFYQAMDLISRDNV